MKANTSALQKAKYKLKILDAEKVDDTKKKRKKTPKQNDEYLFKAISSAMLCTEYIDSESIRLKELVNEYQKQQDTDKYWEIKSNYYKDQIALIEETYPLFSEEAKRRKNLIQSINNSGRWEAERERCKEDTLYWFDNYAWTSDPRKVGIWSLPFMLYPYQREAVVWLEDLIFSKKTSGVIEKSRDLGFSWLLISLFYKHFQHSDGFHALIGSITANECDTIGDPSSMFEKIREQARLQPVGLLPAGWDRSISYMKAINPLTKSTITGSTSNADFGRGGRFSCLTGDTLIQTPDGNRPIKELAETAYPEIIGIDGKIKKVRGYIVKPKEPVYKVTTRGGFSLTGTKDHPLLKVRTNGELEKTEISKLKVHDKLRLITNTPKVPDGWRVKPFDVEIISIEEAGEEITYDLECEGHKFIANGLASHNCILFDEFSSFEMDTAAMTASSQSSPCKIYNSTAKGMGNEFYRLANSGKIEKKTFHWTVHPHKSQSWYDYQKIEMSDIQIAQELDINYESSQHNKVYPEYQEHMHIVTKSEVMRALPSFADTNGNFRIPFGHSIYMGEDVGQTEEHAHMMLWFATLKENTVTTDGIDLSGSVLVYRELQQSPKSAPRIWAESIKKAEGTFESSMISGRFISHEAVTEAEIYSDEYGLHFTNWKPLLTEGISRVKDYLDVVFKENIHPFREHTRKHKYPNAPSIVGRPHIYFVVDDEQGELLYKESTGSYSVTPATDNNGFIRTRFEFPLYHYPQSELGKEVRKMRPKKKDDDCFVKGTLIFTNKGNVPIETLKSGDLVLTRNGFKPVKHCIETKKLADIHRIEFSDNSFLEGTNTHPIFNGVDFIPMDMMECGNTVTAVYETLCKLNIYPKKEKVKEYSTVQLVVKKKAIDTGKRLPVWNLEVEECHEYFANNVLVHNCMDVIRCISTECFPPINKDSRFATIEKELPSGLRLDSIRELPTESLGMAFLQRNQQLRERYKNLQNVGINYRDQLAKDRLC